MQISTRPSDHCSAGPSETIRSLVRQKWIFTSAGSHVRATTPMPARWLIMTENMCDDSDAIADWPLINSLRCARRWPTSVAIHSGGGQSGYMTTSSGVNIIADGSVDAEERLTNDTSLGAMRCAYARNDEATQKGMRHFDLGLMA